MRAALSPGRGSPGCLPGADRPSSLSDFRSDVPDWSRTDQFWCSYARIAASAELRRLGFRVGTRLHSKSDRLLRRHCRPRSDQQQVIAQYPPALLFCAWGVPCLRSRHQPTIRLHYSAMPDKKKARGVLPDRLRETRAFGRETWPGVPGSSPQLQCS